MSEIFEIDITKDHCPMTFVKTKLKLESIPSGSTLRVKLNAGEPLDNVPKSATQQGFIVKGIHAIDNKVHIVEIEKP